MSTYTVTQIAICTICHIQTTTPPYITPKMSVNESHMIWAQDGHKETYFSILTSLVHVWVFTIPHKYLLGNQEI